MEVEAKKDDQEKKVTPVNECEKEPPTGQITHQDQYKMLRDEIMVNLHEIYLTQGWGAVGVASIYTWLITKPEHHISPLAWFLPPSLILLCMIRCYMLVGQISAVAKYLIQIEEASFGEHAKVLGW